MLDAVGSEIDAAAGDASGRAGPASVGSIFYASSAGGIYGGSALPPFTELTPVAPISPYGRFKLDAEAAVSAFGAEHGVSRLLGRIANLYGPGQKLEKMQGADLADREGAVLDNAGVDLRVARHRA